MFCFKEQKWNVNILLVQMMCKHGRFVFVPPDKYVEITWRNCIKSCFDQKIKTKIGFASLFYSQIWFYM